jgi:hypothetical protein
MSVVRDYWAELHHTQGGRPSWTTYEPVRAYDLADAWVAARREWGGEYDSRASYNCTLVNVLCEKPAAEVE